MTISKTKLKVKIRRKTNTNLINLIHFLKKQSSFWMKVAELLAKPKRIAVSVNIEKIDRVAKPNSIIVVPGKVLSDGDLTKNITLAALSFSEKAKTKLTKAHIVRIDALAKENKKGDGIIILR